MYFERFETDCWKPKPRGRRFSRRKMETSLQAEFVCWHICMKAEFTWCHGTYMPHVTATVVVQQFGSGAVLQLLSGTLFTSRPPHICKHIIIPHIIYATQAVFGHTQWNTSTQMRIFINSKSSRWNFRYSRKSPGRTDYYFFLSTDISNLRCKVPKGAIRSAWLLLLTGRCSSTG